MRILVLSETTFSESDFALFEALSQRVHQGELSFDFVDCGSFWPVRFLTKKEAETCEHTQRGGKLLRKLEASLLEDKVKLLYKQALNYDVILSLGEGPLFLLTEKTSIDKWRGSHLYFGGVPVILTYGIPYIRVVYEDHIVWLHDVSQWKTLDWGLLDKTIYKPKWPEPRDYATGFRLEQSAEQVESCLCDLLETADSGSSLLLSVDIETISPYLACLAVAWSPSDALSIPFYSGDPEHPSYYPSERQLKITLLLRKLLLHPTVNLVGQNFQYDLQYLLLWLTIPPVRWTDDTMIAHHMLYPGMRKGLGFLSSLYCKSHIYWKDDGKEFDYAVHEPRRLWFYNCEDASRTWEIMDKLREETRRAGKTELYQEQMIFARMALDTVNEGIGFDKKVASEMILELYTAIGLFEDWLKRAVPEELLPPKKPKAKRSPWYTSPTQQKYLFYEALGLPLRKNRKTGQPTVDDKALTFLRERDPMLWPLLDNLARYRSLGIALNVAQTACDPDGRMRCTFNTAGPETFRFSSSENAFGNGTNFQNISSGEDPNDPAIEALLQRTPSPFVIPNMRRMFVPAPGNVFLDIDLARADAQAVAGHAGDLALLERFDDSTWDMHQSNARDIFGPDAGKPERKLAKAGVHAANYLVFARTLAATLGCSRWEAQHFIDSWFAAHPLIKEWQQAVECRLMTTRKIQNVWGYEIQFWGRIDTKTVQEALAWIGQSTVAILINKIWQNILKEVPWAKVRLQVHDSLVLEIPQYMLPYRHLIRDATRIPIPFECRTHYIATGCKMSPTSWGDVEDISWED